MFKNMKLGAKIGSGFGLLIVLLLIVTGWSYFGIGKIVDNAHTVVNGDKIAAEIAQREIDHLNWVSAVGALLTNDDVTELKVQTDPHKCAFGKWYYGEDSKIAVQFIPEIAEFVHAIEEPHKKLHETAIEIKKVFYQADKTLPKFLAEKEADHLKWVNTCLRLFVENADELKVQTDHRLCGLGKFIYGEHGQKAAASDPELSQLIEAIKEPHKRLHKSAISIQEKWDKNDETAKIAAHEIFTNETMAALPETQKALKAIKDRSEIMIAGMNEASHIYSTKTKQQLVEVQGLLGKIADAANETSNNYQELMADVSSQTSFLVTLISLIAAIIGVVLAVMIARSITKPINLIIAGLAEGAGQVGSASGQVASASQSLAEGSSELASSIEETSSSLEEMAGMTRQNADNTGQANTLALEASTAADKGSTAMNKLADAMKEIKKSSDETAKIIKVIDEIAFQTNLLALNAAVEAARAGNAGKGFAVVADEVRNLAQRSAEAAKDTNSLIEGAQRNADEGVKATGDVDEILNVVSDNIKKVTDLLAEVSAASQEQAQGVDQINSAVSQMDQVTQTTAANAEESSSASEEMAAQAQEMLRIVQDLNKLVQGAKNAGQITTSGQSSYSNKRQLNTGESINSTVSSRAKIKTNDNLESVIPLEEEELSVRFSSI